MAVDPIQSRPPGARVPLASMQRNVINHMRRAGSLHSIRGCITSVRIAGRLDTSLLSASIEMVAQRHESLRTRVVVQDDSGWQEVIEGAQVQWELVDLAHLSALEADEEAASRANEFANHQIDISKDALFAVRLLRLSAERHVLLCAADHLVSDGTSLANLDREIWTLYGQGARGEPFALPAVGAQFGDYALWQEKIRADWLIKHAPYWRDRLAQAPHIRVPVDTSAAKVEDAVGAHFDMSLGRELSAEMRALADRLRSSVSLLICTVYVVLVARWCDRRELVLPLASNARYRSELHSMLGFLASVLRLRIQFAADETFSSLLRQLTREFYAAISHDDMGWLLQLMPEWCIENMDFCFNWVPRFSGRQHLPFGHEEGDSLRIEEFPLRPAGRSTFQPVFSDTAEVIRMRIYYMPHAVPEAVVRRFGQDLCSLAEKFVRNPQDPIDR